MLKPSRSRTSLFSREKASTTTSPEPDSASSPATSPREVRRRSTFHNLFSPPFSTSSSGPSSPSPLNSPSPDLPADPFRWSFRYSNGFSGAELRKNSTQDDHKDEHEHEHGEDEHHHHHQQHQASTVKHPGTSTTPKITVASPSTSTLNLFDDSSFRTRSNLDPSAAHKIARDLSKRQLAESSQVDKTSDASSPPASPPAVKLAPARPARRISHHASSPVLSTASSSPPARKDENHPLSMRTLRRQPSMADLVHGRKNKEAGGEGMQRKVSDATKGISLGRQNEAWKSILSRRESEAWRELVDSRECNLQIPPVVNDDVSPRTRVFPTSTATTPSRTTARTGTSTTGPMSADVSRHESDNTHYMQRDGSIPVLSPSLPRPDLGDPIDFSSPTHTYSHLELSMSGSSGMSRCGTLGSRLDSLPTSVAMERSHARRPMGSSPLPIVDPRELALRRLTTATHDGSLPSKPKAVRRSTSISHHKGSGTEEKRVRAYSLSAKAARKVGLALASNPIPTADKRQTSRGIYLGDLAVDLGGRYCDRSPSGTTETSLYPASSISSPPPQTGRPLHPDLNRSDYSLLAPSSLGLGFSPVGTPVSLPESLQAEAIDLTGNHAIYGPPAPTLPVTPAAAGQTSPADPVPSSSESKQKPSLRRSFLLAQNTFYIPPISAPPSLRSSKSLTNITSPVTPNVSPPVPSIPPSAYNKRRRGTGAFLCSPTDAIDPLPVHTTSPLSLGSEAEVSKLGRKRSTPFLTASNSIRMMFNPIARSLSKSFDKEVKVDSPEENPSSRLKDRISSPINKTGEREWREGLLKEALTASLSGTPEQDKQRRGKPQSRLAIPQQLLEAPVITEPYAQTGMEHEHHALVEEPLQVDELCRQPQGEDEEKQQGDDHSTHGAPRGLEVEAISDMASQASSYTPSAPDHESDRKRTRLKRTPTPVFPRLGSTTRPADIPPPLPTQGDLSRLEAAFASPLTAQVDVTTASKSAVESNIATLPTETTSVARSIRSFSLRPKKSTPRMNLPSPVSSTSPPPGQPLLDALASRDRVLGWRKTVGPDDDTRKVLAWRADVEQNGEMARFEEAIVRHVQREKETMREMRKRDGSSQAGHELEDDDYREPLEGYPADDSFRVDMENEEIELGEFGVAE